MSEDKSESNDKDANAVKGLSVTPAITALFKPTADYVGKEIRDSVKAYVEEKKAKRREKNLEQHLKAVQNKLNQSSTTVEQKEPTLDQLKLYDEWIDNVQDIDIEDIELSKIWESLLAKAASGGAVQSEVLDAIKLITPREARFLYEFSDRIPPLPFKSGTVKSEDRYFANSLEGKGILEKDYSFSVIFITLLGVGLAGLYYFLQQMTFDKYPITAPFIAVAIMFVGISFRAGLARWRLSWLGKTIIKFVKPNK